MVNRLPFRSFPLWRETILPAQQRSWLGFRQLCSYQQLGSQWLHFKTRNQFTWGKGLELHFLQTTEVSCSIHHCLKVVSAASEYFCGSKFNSERSGTGTWLFILERLNGLWEGFFLGHLLVFKLFLGRIWEIGEIWEVMVGRYWNWPVHLKRKACGWVSPCAGLPQCGILFFFSSLLSLNLVHLYVFVVVLCSLASWLLLLGKG